MEIITLKSEVKKLLQFCIEAYDNNGTTGCIEALNTHLLSKKVKFPLLEFCGTELYLHLPIDDHLTLCDEIEALKTEGGNVLLGIILQKRLTSHFDTSIAKATEYISNAHVWYICDIIGERVFGYSLLHEPSKTIPEIIRLSKHPSNWVVRALGAGTHYSIKKGLSKEDVKKVFPILLSLANTRDKEIRQGIGWAAKTTAKFHPDIIQHFKDEINHPIQVANWFRAKVEIGLNRNAYAERNRG